MRTSATQTKSITHTCVAGLLLSLAPLVMAGEGFSLSTRAWLSSGETEWSHCASAACGGPSGFVSDGTRTYLLTLGDPTSKLNYSGIKANSVELVATQRLDQGWRWQGVWGVGSGNGGMQRDEDCLTLQRLGTFKFSDTTSVIRGTSIGHLVLDLGRTQPLAQARLTPFVGFARYQERLSAFGINHLRNDFNAQYPNLPDTVKVFDNDITWTGLRLGSELEWNLSDHSRLMVNAAYVARAQGKNKDSHVLRTSRNDLGPTPNILNEGTGDGWMVDVIGTYGFSRQLSFEVGYRWWEFTATQGTTRFGPNFSQAFPNRSLYSKRDGLLMGRNYLY